MSKKKYVQVGMGGRSGMYREALGTVYSNDAVLTAVCDSNRGRLELAGRQEREMRGVEVRLYDASEFDAMIERERPDCVIVTSADFTHADYICRGMELGCDVITEKPMTIDEERCQRILDMQRATGRNCRVTFNYRYSPVRTQVKDMLMSGVIGEVQSVVFEWMLDIRHGADYFRRWHRNKANSGGLLVHKATHHFDLVNWWLGTAPARVSARGDRRFYTPATAERMGLGGRAERCHGCPVSDRCAFCLDMSRYPEMRQLYLECESHDGYYRDRCVFADSIDIEDSMHLAVDYRNGVKMTYSLNAFCPQEGYAITFYGSEGALEHRCVESTYINADGSVPGVTTTGTWTRVLPHHAPSYEVALWKAEGGHGGGDPVMLDDIFGVNPPQDPYMRAADQRGGAWSILTGISANRSMATGQPVVVADLIHDLPLPDYPAHARGA